MPHPFDIQAVSSSILSELSALLAEDVTDHLSFARRQTLALAKQAAWIAEATALGELDQEDRDWFLASLARSTENFVRAVVALTILTIEKAWNAVVGILWGAIRSAIGAAIPIPRPPSF
jgi:hypothetical protein